MAQKIRPYAKNMVQSWRLCDKRRQMRPHLNSCTADNHHPTRSWPPTPALRAVRTTSGNDRDAVSVDVHWLAHVRACATASRASVPDGRHACFHARDQCDHECHLAVTWLSPLQIGRMLVSSSLSHVWEPARLTHGLTWVPKAPSRHVVARKQAARYRSTDQAAWALSLL